MAYRNTREVKVYEIGGYQHQTVPQIKLTGKWLEELGFSIGEKLLVACQGGKLTITVKDEYIVEE